MPMTAADLTVKVGADTSDFEAGMGKVDSSLGKSKAGMGAATGILGAGAGLIGGGFLFAANSAMNFEGAMADVNASLMPTAAQLAELEKEALKIGATTTFNATEGAQAIEQLGLAGISIPDIMNGGAMSVARLASATGEDLPNSATAMANAMTIFGIAGSDTEAVADTMTAALNESSMTLTDFQQGMASAGVMADSVGMSFEQTSAALALFSANGMSGADAGTSLRSMLTHMANPTAEAAALFDQLGFSLQEGIDSGNLMGYTAEKLTAGLAHMSEEERLAALNTMFGADAQRVANILYGEGAEGVNNMTEKMRANGQAQEAARRRMGGLRGAMESLSGSVETAAIVIGSGLTPFLTVLAEKVGDAVNWLTNLPEPLIRLISVVAGVVGALMGLGAAFGSVMMMGGLIPGGFGAVGSAMLALLGPVALVVAAAVGLYVAFETNFMGIRDIVTGAIDAISNTLSTFGDVIGGMMSGDFARLEEGLQALPNWLEPVGVFMARVTSAAVDLYDAFSAGGLSGLIDAMPAALSTLGSAFSELGSAIIDGVGNIDWGSVGTAMLDGLQTAAEWVGTQALNIGSIAIDVAEWVAGKIGDLWDWLLTTAKGDDDSIDLGNIAVNVLGWVRGAISNVWSWLQNLVLKGTQGDGTGGATAPGSGITLGEVLTNITGWAKGAWPDIKQAIKTALGAITIALADVAVGIFGWSVKSWPAIDEAIENALGTIAVELSEVALQVLSWNPDISTSDPLMEVSNLVAGALAVGILLAIAVPVSIPLALAVVGLVGAAVWVAAQVKQYFDRNPTKAVDVIQALNIIIDVSIDFAWENLPIFSDFRRMKEQINQDLEEMRAAWDRVTGWFGGLSWPSIDLGDLPWPDAPTPPAWMTTAPKWWTNMQAGRFPWDDGGGGGTSGNPTGLQGPAAPEGWSQAPFTGGPFGHQQGPNLPPTTTPEAGPEALPAAPTGTPAAYSGIATAIREIGDASAFTSGQMAGVNTNMGGLVAYGGPVTGFGAIATTTFSATGESAKGNLQPIGGYVAQMAGSIVGSALPAFSSVLSGARSSFTGVQSEAQSRFAAMASSIGSNTANAAATALANATGMSTGVKGQVSGMATDASAKASSMNTKINAEALGMQVGALAKAAAMAMGFAVQMSLMVSTATTAGSQVTSAMQTGMQGATAAVSAHAQGWVAIVNAAAGSLGAAGFNAGAAAGFGVANGLNSALGAVQAAAAAIASAAAAAMDLALEVASPSKVTRRTGRFAGLGLAGGILDLQSQVVTNAKQVATAAAKAFAIDAVAPVMAVEAVYQSSARPRGLMQARSGEAPQYVYNDHRAFTVKVDDLPELVRAKEFFDDIERDREMMYGGH